MENKIITGTGHRFLRLPGSPHMRAIKGRLQSLLIEFCINRFSLAERPAKFISGGALGFDISAALAAVEIDVPLVLALPFPDHEKRWPLEFRHQLDFLKERAVEVVHVSKGSYHKHKLTRRTHWMIDRADSVAALWDGRNSSTGDTITYAYSRRVPVDNMWRDFIQHSDEIAL